LTNSQKLVDYFGVEWPWSTGLYSTIVIAWGALVFVAWRTARTAKVAADVSEPELVSAAGPTR
jgi:uncharacterized protein